MTPPIPDAYLSSAAERFRLLGDPVRLRLLNLLIDRGEAPVHDLAIVSGQSHQNTSKHLRKLAEGGLVACRRDGVEILYHVADPTIPGLCVLVCGAVREREASRAAAER